jgi:uncharacterized protein
MSEENLPPKVDPFRFAENAVRLHGKVLVKDMQRLCESLYQDTGEVGVEIEFGKNEQSIPFVRGQLTGALRLQCQRCMESFGYEITNTFWLAVVHTEEEAEMLPQGYDSIIANDDILILQDMVEDELIVNLPVVPMHDPKHCKVTLPLIIESEQTNPMEKENPFKVIEFLRAKRDLK